MGRGSCNDELLKHLQDSGAETFHDIENKMVYTFFFNGERQIRGKDYCSLIKVVLKIAIPLYGEPGQKILEMLPAIKSGKKNFQYLTQAESTKIRPYVELKSLGDVVRKLFKKAGVRTDEGTKGLRVLRHHLITYLLSHGVECDVVSSIVGHSSQAFRSAYILLNCDKGEFSDDTEIKNVDICKVLKIGERTIDQVKKKFIEQGFEGILERRASIQVYSHKADGDIEAKIVSLCCSEPPKGFTKWSLHLIANQMIELNYIDYISHVTVGKVLKKNELKPWKVKGWVIPPHQNSQFVANMEDVLDVYKLPYDENFPVVCMDESPKQLIEQVASTAIKPGQEARVDYEYIRHGMVNIFMANEPLKGERLVEVTEHKTKNDWAKFIKRIAEEMHPNAKKIKLVMDNFKTHDASAFYETFEPEQAKQLWDRFEFVFTPKHGSWLNMAEIELHVLNGQCLNRHISTIEKITTEVNAWQYHRNNKNSKINWQFTNNEARVKLKRLYRQF